MKVAVVWGQRVVGSWPSGVGADSRSVRVRNRRDCDQVSCATRFHDPVQGRNRAVFWVFEHCPPPEINNRFTENLPRNLPVKKNLANRLRFDRIVAMSLWPHFFGPPCIYLLSYHDLYLIICLITSYSIWSHDYVCRPIRSFCSCLSCFCVFFMF